MTNQQHPITPPPELVQQWMYVNNIQIAPLYMAQAIATQAARWGADQELEACCEWVSQWCCIIGGNRPEVGLRAARRPITEPPSLKELAMEMLDCIPTHDNGGRSNGIDLSIIRRALEQLND